MLYEYINTGQAAFEIPFFLISLFAVILVVTKISVNKIRAETECAAQEHYFLTHTIYLMKSHENV